MSLSEFLDMGGYAFYVWTSYGIALVLLVSNLLLPIYRCRHLLAEMSRRQRRARAGAPGAHGTPRQNES